MFFFSGFPAGLYSAPQNIPGGSIHDAANLTQSSPQAIYEIYDRLAAAHPSYVTKQVMGEVEGHSINRYTFSNYSLDTVKIFA